MAVVIVGLGPGDPKYLTQEAWRILSEAPRIYVRTREHPTIAALPPDKVFSFDDVYAREIEFVAVYEEIARRVVELGTQPGGIVYAVPGHPCVGEWTTRRIRELAQERGLEVRVVDGLSFLEPIFAALNLDPLEQMGLQIADAMVIAQRHYPPLEPSRPALIAQCDSRTLASDVKLTLLSAYPEDHPVIVLSGAGTDTATIRQVPLAELDHSSQFDHLTTLYLPPVAPGGSMTDLLEVMARLRAPDGCPWDRQQTHESLRAYLLEETYEVLAALDCRDVEALCEELGDLLLQIVFHIQIASEGSLFRMADITRGIVTKLWRRHPHVFGNVLVSGVGEVLHNWEAIKADERNHKSGYSSPLSGIPQGLPALAQAQAYLARAERLGLNQPADLSTVATLLSELEHAPEAEEHLGQVLLILVNWARQHDLDAESALRVANTHLATQVDQLYEGVKTGTPIASNEQP
jgi:tetrapyrrole methylase family protein/MazG family protein